MNYRKAFSRITLIIWSTIAVIFVMWSISLHTAKAHSLFDIAANYGTGEYPFSVAIGDLNGDGDLVVANAGCDNVSIPINIRVPCYGVLNLSIENQSLNTTETFEACETITAGPAVTVTSTGNVTFQAGERVILKSGFSVEEWGLLSATVWPIVWTQNFGGPSYEEARSVIETADGSLIVAGWSNTENNKEDVYVVKTDSNGCLIWENTYGTDIHERAYAIRETADGFVIAGRATSVDTPLKEHMLLLKIDKNGELIWEKLFGKDQASGARDVQVTSDGGYVIAGWTSTKRHTDASDIYVVKTNQDGDVEWEQRYQRVLWQAAHNILQDSNNGYVISGIERPSAGARLNGYAMGIDSSGAFMWDRTDGGNEWDEWHGITHAVDYGFVLSGGTKLSDNKRRAWIMKIDPMGGMTWKNELMGTYAYSWTIVQGHDGGYVFTGESADLCDGYVVKIDESGEYIWGATLGSDHEYFDCLRSLVATSDGGYVLVGYVGKEQGARPTSGYQPDWDRDLWLVKIQ